MTMDNGKIRCPECEYDQPSLNMARPELRCPNCEHTWPICANCRRTDELVYDGLCADCAPLGCEKDIL